MRYILNKEKVCQSSGPQGVTSLLDRRDIPQNKGLDDKQQKATITTTHM